MLNYQRGKSNFRFIDDYRWLLSYTTHPILSDDSLVNIPFESLFAWWLITF